MGYRFNTPPNWPAPPSPDWRPPEGWQADASWGPAPDGWSFWVEDPTFAGQPSETGAAAAPTVARKNWFLRHKVITAVAAVLLFSVFAGIANGNSTKTITTASVADPLATSAATPDQAALDKAAADKAAADKVAADQAATDKAAADKAAADKAATDKAAADKAATDKAAADKAAAGKAAADKAAADKAAADKAAADQAAAAAAAVPVAQQNAKRSAESYIEMSGFSRSGLIKQLQFEGFAEKDANRAIDSMNVNWNTEAEQSAKSYMEMSGFSRSGLIGQLEFEGFTNAQAAHGADSVGL
jgi:hypothetical protein